MTNPIFLLASERSGTNLLRRRFTEWQKDVFGPSPLHFLKHLYYAEPYYGDLENDSNFSIFVEDALGLAYHHFSPWDIEISADQVIESYSDLVGQARSAVGVMHVLYTLYAQRKGYRTYFCKDNNLFDFVSDIRIALPQARFVYLYRDPRDVVLSQSKRPLQNQSIAYLSKLWRDEQIKCIRHAKSLARDGLLVSVSYEDLISDENAVMKSLCHAFGAEVDSKRQEVFARETNDIQEWSNLNKPTIRDNSGKFREGLSVSAVRKIESICWHQMRWLSYEPVNDSRPNFSRVRASLEATGGKLSRVVRARVSPKGTTAAQKERIRYIKRLQVRWR